MASEPVWDIVVGPNDGVEEVLQVEDQEPEDKRSGADIAIGEVPEHGRDDEERDE